MKNEIKLPIFGIVVTLTGDGGSITSALHTDEYECFDGPEFITESIYNGGVDGIESLILAHACAGIDITTPAYLEGVETAVNALENNT